MNNYLNSIGLQKFEHVKEKNLEKKVTSDSLNSNSNKMTILIKNHFIKNIKELGNTKFNMNL